MIQLDELITRSIQNSDANAEQGGWTKISVKTRLAKWL